jgi:hypothetical protein
MPLEQAAEQAELHAGTEVSKEGRWATVLRRRRANTAERRAASYSAR